MAGGGRLGVIYGTYDLLEKLGIRWYMPTRLGEVVPERDTIEVGKLDIR